jgi:hypothetical protein
MLTPDLSGLTFTPSGFVAYHNTRIDCIVVSTTQDLNVQNISLAHFGRKIFSPGNALSILLGKKLNFVIMHSAKAAGYLDKQCDGFIDKHVPLTYLIKGRGTPADLHTMLMDQKDGSVLKKSHSWQGRDVVIGSFAEEATWRDTILTATESTDIWIAQEFVKPDALPFAIDGEVKEIEAIWAVFGFGDTYGGAMIRYYEPELCNGVINAARGATEALVLES